MCLNVYIQYLGHVCHTQTTNVIHSIWKLTSKLKFPRNDRNSYYYFTADSIVFLRRAALIRSHESLKNASEIPKLIIRNQDFSAYILLSEEVAR